MTIDRVEDGGKGAFVALDHGKEAGLMTYVWAGQDRIIIDHTEVNPDHKGQGLGKKMVMEAVGYARAEGIKIVPLCPFAKSVFDKVPEIRDVL